MGTQLTWSHCRALLSIKDYDKINYYIYLTLSNNLSKRELEEKIKNNEYERLPDESKIKLIRKEKYDIKDFIKNPVIIKNSNNYKVISEKILQKLINEDMNNFLIELGDKYNYIDLLLYNIKFKCYVVVEFKITELKKEHIGQIQTYMNYIDKNIKTIEENKTVGIIIVRKDEKYFMEYCSDERILTREYVII